MVAYSFKRQFIEPIQAGTKCQTIRAHRKRHARPGEPVQLYYALRTKQARKLVEPDPICISVQRISFNFVYEQVVIVTDSDTGATESYSALAGDIDAFAVSDGFANWGALVDFWGEGRQESDPLLHWSGWLIKWKAPE